MNPKVTIITGYYNREEYVDYSIQSLLNQSFTDFELIIFDDCSTDNTYKKLESVVKSDTRVKLIRHQSNIGFVNGMIEAVKIAKGEYIAVHGSGDISINDRIEKQSKYLNDNNDVVIVGCHYLNKDPSNNKTKLVSGKNLYTRNELFNSNPLSHGEVMFRKNVYNQVGGYRSIFKFSQDKDLWLRMGLHGKIAILQEVLYERIINFEGVSYKVEKLIEQKKYSYLANIINNLNNEEQIFLEENVKLKGIDHVVDINEKFIQLNMLKMFNVLMAKNRLSNINLFISNSKGINKIYYSIFGNLYKLKLFRRTLRIAYQYMYTNK